MRDALYVVLISVNIFGIFLLSTAHEDCVSGGGVVSKCIPEAECKLTNKQKTDVHLSSELSCNLGSNKVLCCPNFLSESKRLRMARMAGINSPACGTSMINHIAHGDKTVPGMYPWVAVLGYVNASNDLSFYCGGSLITDSYVLTAAHCLKPGSELVLKVVRLFEYDFRTVNDCISLSSVPSDNRLCTSHMDISVLLKIIHPLYRVGVYNHDIGLIRLSRSVPHSVPICLPLQHHEPSLDQYDEEARFTVAGFGLNENDKPTDVLLEARLKELNHSVCVRIMRSFGTILNKRHMCTFGVVSGADTCKGDSGGSLMAYGGSKPYTAVAVVAFGLESCGVPGIPGIFTRVDRYIDWILESILFDCCGIDSKAIW